jgi:uncharacterized membrane protein
MRRPLLLLLAAGILTACAETSPPLAPDREGDLNNGLGLGPPKTRNITTVNLRFSQGIDIDEEGRVVGYDQSRTGISGVLWTPSSPRGTSGSITDLGSLGGTETFAFGINEEGLITGGSNNHAFVWNGSINALTEPAGAAASFADDVSDPSSGTRYVAGRIDFSDGSRAAVWRLSGSDLEVAPDLLPGLRADNAGQAFAVNAAGTAVGDALDDTGLNQPVRWTLSGSTWTPQKLDLSGGTYGQAFDVNAAGVAVGYQRNTAGCDRRGLVWAPGSTTPTALQDLDGGPCSVAWAINNAGHITGSARDAFPPPGRNQAVLWIPIEGGGYSILALSRLGGEGRGLNEPVPDASGIKILEVVGGPGATLWKVKLP